MNLSDTQVLALASSQLDVLRLLVELAPQSQDPDKKTHKREAAYHLVMASNYLKQLYRTAP